MVTNGALLTVDEIGKDKTEGKKRFKLIIVI